MRKLGEMVKMDTDPVLKRVELALPAFLMVYVAKKAVASGFEFREDISDALVIGAAKTLESADVLVQELATTKLESMMSQFVTLLPNTSIMDAVMASCMFILKLVDDGLYADPAASSVLTAMVLREEAEQDPEVWGVTWAEVTSSVSRMQNRAQFSGLYLKPIGKLLV